MIKIKHYINVIGTVFNYLRMSNINRIILKDYVAENISRDVSSSLTSKLNNKIRIAPYDDVDDHASKPQAGRPLATNEYCLILTIFIIHKMSYKHTIMISNMYNYKNCNDNV